MSTTIARFGVLSLVVLLLGACGDSVEPDPDPTLSGSWSGTATTSGGSLTVNATLNDASGTVSGSGNIVGEGLNCAHSASGTRSGSNFSVSFTCQDFDPVSYTGTVTATTMSGALNGSGFDNFAFTMQKQ